MESGFDSNLNKQNLKNYITLTSMGQDTTGQAQKCLDQWEQTSQQYMQMLLEMFYDKNQVIFLQNSIQYIKENNILILMFDSFQKRTKKKLESQQKIRQNRLIFLKKQLISQAKLSKDFRNKIKNVLVKFLDEYQETNPQMKQFRGQIDDCVKIIANSSFPHNYKKLKEYIINNLKQCNKAMESGQFKQLFQSRNTITFLTTMRNVIEGYAQKSIKMSYKQEKQHAKEKLEILQGIYNFWKKFTEIQMDALSKIKNIDQNQQTLTQLFKLSSLLDDGILYTLMCQGNNMEYNNDCKVVLDQFMVKVSKYIPKIQVFKNEQQLKNLKGMILHMTELQKIYPFAFVGTQKNALFNYLQLSNLICITNFNNYQDAQNPQRAKQMDDIKKSALIILHKVINQYEYFASLQQFQKKNINNQRAKYQQAAHKTYKNYFTPTKVQEILGKFIENILPYHYQLEKIVEPDETYYDRNQELDNEIHNIAMQCIKGLMKRYPLLCIQFTHNLVHQLMNSNLI